VELGVEGSHPRNRSKTYARFRKRKLHGLCPHALPLVGETWEYIVCWLFRSNWTAGRRFCNRIPNRKTGRPGPSTYKHRTRAPGIS